MARNFHIIFACHYIHPLTIYTVFSGLFAISMDGKQRHIVYKFSLAIEIVYITRKLYQFEDKYMHSNYFYRHVLLHFHIKLRLDIKQICVFCIYGITGLGLSIYCVWTWKGTHIFLHLHSLRLSSMRCRMRKCCTNILWNIYGLLQLVRNGIVSS